MGVAARVVAWLESLAREFRNIMPVSVTIEGDIFEGAGYINENGDVVFYLVGERPSSRRSRPTCYVMPGVEHEYFVAGYTKAETVTDGRYAHFHPFGQWFALHPWSVPGDTKIDEHEEVEYRRVGMDVRIMEEQS